MSINLDEYRKLKKSADAARAKAERAAGALEQKQAELKSEHGCDSIADAEKLLKKLAKQEAAAEKKYDAAYAEFREQWEDKL